MASTCHALVGPLLTNEAADIMMLRISPDDARDPRMLSLTVGQMKAGGEALLS